MFVSRQNKSLSAPSTCENIYESTIFFNILLFPLLYMLSMVFSFFTVMKIQSDITFPFPKQQRTFSSMRIFALRKVYNSRDVIITKKNRAKNDFFLNEPLSDYLIKYAIVSNISWPLYMRIKATYI